MNSYVKKCSPNKLNYSAFKKKLIEIIFVINHEINCIKMTITEEVWKSAGWDMVQNNFSGLHFMINNSF